MGRRGPLKKPDHLLKLHGSTLPQGRRPKEPISVPVCPNWLSPECKKVWRWIVPLLKSRGTINVLDRDYLTTYCLAVVGQRKCAEMITKGGWGERDSNPHDMFMKYSVLMARSAKAFGLSPDARERMKPVALPDEKPEEDSLLAKLTASR